METISYNPRRLSSTSKSSNGCWTCKLRKKKCDETSPVCRTCETLHITCYYLNDKPEWMDGGLKQERMAAHMKREVKDNAHFRSFNTVPITFQPTVEARAPPSPIAEQSITSEVDLSRPSMDLPVCQQSSRTGSTTAVQTPEEDRMLVDESTSRGGLHRTDSVLMMFYIEHIFSFLFPFYDPPVLKGGKAWILEMISKPRSSQYHSVSKCLLLLAYATYS